MCGGAVAGIQSWGALLAIQICNNIKNRTEPITAQICSDERHDGVSVKGEREEVMKTAVSELK